MAKALALDTDGRSRQLRIFSISSPHMRAFHISWISFFAAFTCWFALNPLLKSTVGPDIGLTESQVSSTDIANVGSTIFFRLAVGVFTDRYGPRLAMGLILLLGPVPLLAVGFVKNVGQMAAARTFVGILGASFVPCQYWTTTWFAPNIVGTANAVAGGWGNMGGGATFLLMPNVYSGFVSAGLTPHQAWRVALLVPAVFCWLCAIACIFLSPKTKPLASLPTATDGNGDRRASVTVVHSELPVDDDHHNDSSLDRLKPPVEKDPSEIEQFHAKQRQESGSFVQSEDPAPTSAKDRKGFNKNTLSAYLTAICSLPTIILMLHYACSFGVELSVDSVIGSYLQKRFGLNQSMAGNIGSIFGLMNLFSRAVGGILSDVMQRRFGMLGRIGIQMLLLTLNGICLIMFSFTESLASAVTVMVLFSFLTESVCGSTFGIVPYVAAQGMGMASGLVGAGGTAGGALFNVLFHHYVAEPQIGFRIMGAVVMTAGLSTAALKVGGYGIFSRDTKK